MVGSLSASALSKSGRFTWGRRRGTEPTPRGGPRFRIDMDPGFGAESLDLANFHWDLLESLMDHVPPIEVVT
jgi:hypothetical protein